MDIVSSEKFANDFDSFINIKNSEIDITEKIVIR